MQKFYDDMKKREKIYQFKDLDLAMESLDNLCVNFDRMHQSVDRFKNVMIGRKRVAVENFSGNEVAMESHGELIGALIGIVVIISAIIAKVLWHLLHPSNSNKSSSFPSYDPKTTFEFKFEDTFKKRDYSKEWKTSTEIVEGEAEKKARIAYYDAKKDDQRLLSFYRVYERMSENKIEFSQADKVIDGIERASSNWFSPSALTADMSSIIRQIESQIDKEDGNIDSNLIQPIQDRTLGIGNILKSYKYDDVKTYLQDFAEYTREEKKESEMHLIKKNYDQIKAANFTKTCDQVAKITAQFLITTVEAKKIAASLEQNNELMKTIENKLVELQKSGDDFAKYEQSRLFVSEMRNYLFKVKDIIVLKAMMIRLRAVIYRSAVNVISDLCSFIIAVYASNPDAKILINEAKSLKRQMSEAGNYI